MVNKPLNNLRKDQLFEKKETKLIQNLQISMKIIKLTGSKNLQIRKINEP